MSLPSASPQRVRTGYVLSIEQRLSPRDWHIIQVVATTRLATGRQLEALCFSDLSGRSRPVVRGRVLHRLVRWRVLQPLDQRRIGGSGGGSSSLTFGIDTVGAILSRGHFPPGGKPGRNQSLPGDRFVAHTLAVTQLYADLSVAVRSNQGVRLDSFTAEPACWWPDGIGGELKPDAYVGLSTDQVRDHWWIEVDRATESLPTVKRKLLRYLDFARRGQTGPGGVLPRVMVSVHGQQRLESLRRLLPALPAPAGRMVLGAQDSDTALALLVSLKE